MHLCQESAILFNKQQRPGKLPGSNEIHLSKGCTKCLFQTQVKLLFSNYCHDNEPSLLSGTYPLGAQYSRGSRCTDQIPIFPGTVYPLEEPPCRATCKSCCADSLLPLVQEFRCTQLTCNWEKQGQGCRGAKQSWEESSWRLVGCHCRESARTELRSSSELRHSWQQSNRLNISTTKPHLHQKTYLQAVTWLITIPKALSRVQANTQKLPTAVFIEIISHASDISLGFLNVDLSWRPPWLLTTK